MSVTKSISLPSVSNMGYTTVGSKDIGSLLNQPKAEDLNNEYNSTSSSSFSQHGNNNQVTNGTPLNNNTNCKDLEYLISGRGESMVPDDDDLRSTVDRVKKLEESVSSSSSTGNISTVLNTTNPMDQSSFNNPTDNTFSFFNTINNINFNNNNFHNTDNHEDNNNLFTMNNNNNNMMGFGNNNGFQSNLNSPSFNKFNISKELPIDQTSQQQSQNQKQQLTSLQQNVNQDNGNSHSGPVFTLETRTGKINVTPYSSAMRAKRVDRYLKKKKQRSYQKIIRYQCRKRLADSRPRVKGRFVKSDSKTKSQ
eukprot:gb/GECH01012091.1/.p1 GENE.gb/GECH01012091.1/~~gb/GECH01012091.1/.p1  ORF type:complete len:308 (+),score=84.43 gb/GECH01012091.1/:1-924(+)